MPIPRRLDRSDNAACRGCSEVDFRPSTSATPKTIRRRIRNHKRFPPFKPSLQLTDSRDSQTRRTDTEASIPQHFRITAMYDYAYVLGLLRAAAADLERHALSSERTRIARMITERTLRNPALAITHRLSGLAEPKRQQYVPAGGHRFRVLLPPVPAPL